MKFEIKNRITGDVQFECELDAEYENESYGFKLGLAVKIAIKKDADLRFTNLRSANLRSADLSSANLRFADLRFADLRFADLRSANLSSADLRSADLRSANLRSADLSSTDLRETKYTDEITIERQPLFIYGLNWDITILDEHMKIGCELHLIKDWLGYDDNRIIEMDGKTALKFWRANKGGLIAIAHGDKRGLKE